MSEPIVLIISDQTDAHVPLVAKQLEALHTPFVPLHPVDFPARVQLSLMYEDRSARLLLRLPGRQQVDGQLVRSIWYRKPHPCGLPADLPVDQRLFAGEECNAALLGLYNNLRCTWISHPWAIQRSSNKPYQLHVAQCIGFVIPRTLITNDATRVRLFYEELKGRLIYKTLSRPFFLDPSSEGGSLVISAFVYTTPINARHLQFLDSLKFAPGIFQEYVPKRLELRITVVGEQIFAAEIHSQDSLETLHDWRRDQQGHTQLKPHKLPRRQKKFCLELVDRLDLNYAAIDMILTPDGRYVFLEINPNGEYGWVEHQTGLPISRAIAELLAGIQ